MKCNLTAILLLIALVGCSASPGNRYYTLSSSYPPASAIKPANNESWALGAVTVPEVLNRPQIILKSGQNGIDILEYDRWAEPMDSMVYRVLSDDLVARLGLHSPTPVQKMRDKRITVAMDEFDADKTGRVFLSGTWTVQTGETTARYVFRRSVKAEANTVSAIVAAQSQLLGDLAGAIAEQH